MRFIINPPPDDERCTGCNKHIDELPECKCDLPWCDGYKLVRTTRQFCGQLEPTWECDDCLGLSDEEYWDKRMERENVP
jgi:hypothetical protein